MLDRKEEVEDADDFREDDILLFVAQTSDLSISLQMGITRAYSPSATASRHRASSNIIYLHRAGDATCMARVAHFHACFS